MARKQRYMTYNRKGKAVYGMRARISTGIAEIGNFFERGRNARSARKIGRTKGKKR